MVLEAGAQHHYAVDTMTLTIKFESLKRLLNVLCCSAVSVKHLGISVSSKAFHVLYASAVWGLRKQFPNRSKDFDHNMPLCQGLENTISAMDARHFYSETTDLDFLLLSPIFSDLHYPGFSLVSTEMSFL